MRDIYFIGGSPCSGKSSIAEKLSTELGFAYYKLDDFLFQYMEEAARAGKPICAAQLSMEFEEMWMRDPVRQADEELAMYEEIFPCVMRDIARLSPDEPVVAEGAGLLPMLMQREHIARNRYICIVPTDAFQRENYAKRAWIGQFLSGCKNPDAAFDNWMSRDALFAGAVLQQAESFGYHTITVDGTRDIEANYRTVLRVFEICKDNFTLPANG